MSLTDGFLPAPLFFEAGSSQRQKPFQAVRRTRAKARAILCAQCRATVTFEEARIEVKGAHHHRFFNPRGIIFQIGCFREAAGCRPIGPASGEFTWFAGFLWRMAECGACRLHLGWSFSKEAGASFFGLILDRLVEGPRGEDRRDDSP